MKYLKYMLFLLFIMFFWTLNVRAISMTGAPKNANVGSTFEIQFKNPGSNSGYKLSYDSKYLSVENLCRGTVDVSVDKMPCVIKFTVNSSLQLTDDVSTTISVDDIGQNASESASLSVTINKNVKKPSPSQDSSTTTTTEKKTTTTTTENKKSDNAYLKAISVIDDKGSEVLITPNFKKDVYEYSLEVDGDIKTVTVNPQVEDSKANVILSNNAMEELKEGENNKIIITVTAESGAQKAYVLNIKKEALNADATLSKLTIKEVSSFKFSPEKYEYDINLDEEVDELTIDPTLSDENAIIEITGNENLKDGSVIKILVTAADGTKKEYKLNIVIKKVTTTKRLESTTSDKNPIVILVLSMIAFTLIGSLIYVIKKK